MATPDELAPFVLRDVRGLDSGEKKGSGAYGAVYEVSVKGVLCIAKRIHDILVNQEVSRRERESIQQKFRQECVILSKLKHPNVVYFVGVHYGRAPGDLSLVMEKLHTDLAKCLDGAVETQQDILPLSIKLSILLDVSGGLLYLHTLPQAIIHRDLSAGNILLTRHMQAKIADLGVSKLIDLRKAKVHTRAPGTSDYMPPEALQKKPVYDTKLDVFSFGHLMLYTILQELPEVYENVTPEALRRGTAQILKRETSLDKIGKDHVLYPLTIQCLQDRPERRPTTLELNQAVMELSNKHPIDLMGGFHKAQEYVSIGSRVSAQSKEIVALKEQIGRKDDEIAALNAQAQAYKEDFEHEREDREAAVSKMEEERAKLNYQFHELGTDTAQNIELYQSEAKRLQAENYQIVERFDALQLELAKHKDLLKHTRAQQKETQVQLHESHQRLEKIIADAAKLHDEVLAKTQQVKQYKKQADGYRAQLEQNKAELQQNRAELEQYRSQLAASHHHAQQREELQFRDNDQLRMILSQYNIPHPPRLEATPTPQRLPPSTAAPDIARARMQPPQQPHPQQYAPMSPQAYQHSEQEAYHQQKLQEAIQQKEQRLLLEQKRQQELALQQQLQMQGYSDPHIQGQQRPLMLPPKPMPRMQKPTNVTHECQQTKVYLRAKKKNPESQPCKVLGCCFRGDEELGGLCRDCYAREAVPQYRHLSTSSSTEDTEEPQSVDEDLPLDLNLQCPRCEKTFRIGHIQRFRHHTKLCGAIAMDPDYKSPIRDQTKCRLHAVVYSKNIRKSDNV